MGPCLYLLGTIKHGGWVRLVIWRVLIIEKNTHIYLHKCVYWDKRRQPLTCLEVLFSGVRPSEWDWWRLNCVPLPHDLSKLSEASMSWMGVSWVLACPDGAPACTVEEICDNLKDCLFLVGIRLEDRKSMVLKELLLLEWKALSCADNWSCIQWVAVGCLWTIRFS